VAYVPVQGRNSSLPDVIAMPVKGRKGYRLFAEIEFSTAYNAKAIEMKLERAWAQDAIPILVFNNKSTAESCYRRYGVEAFILLFNEDDVCTVKEGGVMQLKSQEIFDIELYCLYTGKKVRESGQAEPEN
jgi:hypothetical protein